MSDLTEEQWNGVFAKLRNIDTRPGPNAGGEIVPTASPTPSAGAPVAWQYRFKQVGVRTREPEWSNWINARTEARAKQYGRAMAEEHEIRPLYAAPPPQPDAVRKAAMQDVLGHVEGEIAAVSSAPSQDGALRQALDLQDLANQIVSTLPITELCLPDLYRAEIHITPTDLASAIYEHLFAALSSALAQSDERVAP
jgi:hypothetical protein